MKKLFLVSMLLTVLLITPSISAYADEYEPAKAEISVEIIQGGTAVIIPEVNSPVPDKAKMKLENGEIGTFNIYFTEVGVYTYSIKEVPDNRNLQFDSTVYDVKIYVTEEDGELVTTVVAYNGDDKYSSHSTIAGSVFTGPERLLFSNYKKGGENESTTKPSDDKPPRDQTTDANRNDGGNSSRRSRNPKTGDDTKMEQYFLFAMIASAGLLILSIVYMIDTNRFINSNKQQ